MIVDVSNGILLTAEQKTFKGSDGKDVTYVRATYIDDDNNYHQGILAKDVDLGFSYDEVNRFSCKMQVDITEQDNKLKKKIIHVE